MSKKFLFAALAAAISISVISCADSAKTSTEKKDSGGTTMDAKQPEPKTEEAGVMVGGANMVPSKNIVENAANSADHTTLVAAVKAADLAGTLSGAGPFTVFAPTNEAFNKLPAGTVDALLTPEKKGDLSKILTYHVVAGSALAADLKDGQELTTVQGEKLTVGVKDGKVTLKDAKGGVANVTIADVKSSNGVTHVIDAVLLPK